MPWILAGGGAVVVAVAVVLIFVLTSGSSGSPQDLAESAVEALNNKDAQTLDDLACESAKSGSVDAGDFEGQLPGGVEIKFELGSVEESGSEARADVKISFSGDLPEGLPESSLNTTADLVMADESGWCLKDFQPAGGGGGSGP
ncbi:hypothetical protein [Actinophytocola sp.]|uniref:Rv0361 family membrane protein n=1 Tax=Actinophytocola sp. TaxID=1872138 RepID=UPI003D6BE240